MNHPNVPSSRRSGFGILNTLLLTASAALLVWGGLYVGRYSGRFDGNEFNELPYGRPAKAVGGGGSILPPGFKEGLAAYNLTCLACHQADGMGNPSLNIPPLAGSDWVQADAPNRIVRIVMHGLKGPVKVKDTVWNGPGIATPNAMNPWFKTADNPSGLDPQAIADVLTYVRNSWGNKAAPVTLEQVKAIVEAEKARDATTQWTAEELEKIPATGGGGAAPAALTPDQLKDALKKLSADQLKAVLEGVQK